MKPRHKRAAIIAGGLATLGLAAYLVLNAFQSNLVFFFSPTQVAAGEAPKERTFRIGGLVKEGTVKRIEETFGIAISDSDGTQRSFVSIASLADFIHAHAPTKRSQTQRHAGVSISYPALTWTAPV